MILMLGVWLSGAALFGLVTSDFTWQNMTVALLITAGLMLVFRKQTLPGSLPPAGLSMHLILYAPVLIWYLLVDILKGTFQVLMITLGLRPLVKPGIVKIPLGAHSAAGVGPVGFFITLSPGSFLVDIDWEKRVMLVHVIDASNPRAVRRDAEKYYRLWEYGEYLPEGLRDPDDDREGRPDA